MHSRIDKARKIISNQYKSIIPWIRLPMVKLCMEPTFLVIGAQKAGTSSLFKYLIQHPDILAPVVKKEIHFFDLYYNRGRYWYQGNFPLRNEKKITGEKSPYCLFHPLAPERCWRSYSNLRLIVLLRDPVMRAYSHFHHEIKNRRESRPLRQALTEDCREVEAINGLLKNGEILYSKVHHRYSYLARGMYVEQLDQWMKFYSRDQLYLETAERFFREPQVVCKEIFTFLGVEPFCVSTEKSYNRGRYLPITEDEKDLLAKTFFLGNQQLAEKYGVDISGWT